MTRTFPASSLNNGKPVSSGEPMFQARVKAERELAVRAGVRTYRVNAFSH